MNGMKIGRFIGQADGVVHHHDAVDHEAGLDRLCAVLQGGIGAEQNGGWGYGEVFVHGVGG